MALKILTGRTGTGKSTLMYQDIQAHIAASEHQRLWLIVPEQMSFQAEKRLLTQIGNKAGLRVQVMGLSRLSAWILTESGGTSKAILDKSGKFVLMNHLIRQAAPQLPLFSKAIRRGGFSAAVGDMIAEFKRYNVDAEKMQAACTQMPDNFTAQKFRELAILWTAYQKSMGMARMDAEDRMLLAIQRLKTISGLGDVHIWVDQFQSFAPLQQSLLEGLALKVGSLTVSLTVDKLVHGDDLFNSAAASAKNLLYSLQQSGSETTIVNGLPVCDTCTLVHAGEENHRHKFAPGLTALEAKLVKTAKQADGLGFIPEDIALTRADNPMQEVRLLCWQIVSKCRDEGYRWRDMAVLCPTGGDYEAFLEPMLRLHGIPYFIDAKRSLANNPVSLAITGFFEVIRSNWQHDDVFRLLRTGLLPFASSEIDRLENYILEMGIRGRLAWANEWVRISQDPLVDLIVLNDLRLRFVTPIARFRKVVRGNMPVETVLRAFMQLLADMAVPQHVQMVADRLTQQGDMAGAAHHRQVWRAFCGLMDQIHILLTDETTNLNDLQEMIVSGLAGTETAVIPPSMDEVFVGSLERSRMASVRVLFVLGAVDGWFPTKTASSGLLTDHDRDLAKDSGLHLAPNARDLALERENDVYLALTAPKEKLVVSWSVSDSEGKSLRPSGVVGLIKRLFPHMKEQSYSDFHADTKYFLTTPQAVLADLVNAKREQIDEGQMPLVWHAVENWFLHSTFWQERARGVLSGLSYKNRTEQLDAEWLKQLWGDNLTTSASALEQYRHCPFSYFAGKLVMARERRDNAFRDTDFGTLMHGVMETAVRLVGLDKGNWDIDGHQLDMLADQAVTNWQALQPAGSTLPPGYAGWFGKRLKQAAKSALDAVSHHMRAGRFVPIAQELDFGMGGEMPALQVPLTEGTLYLQGRLDRLDVCEIDGIRWLRVVDYKSGGRSVSLYDCVEGLDVQLVAYLSAAISSYAQSGIVAKPGGMFFMRLEPSEIRERETDAQVLRETQRKRLRLSGYVLENDAVMDAMDIALSGSGKSDVIPVSRKKDGTLSKTSRTLTENEFAHLRDAVTAKIAHSAVRMKAGHVEIRPVRKQQEKACDYCPYPSFCAFEAGVGGVNWERLQEASDADVREKLGGTAHVDD